MNRLLQRFGIEESPYERPERAWVCGWAAEGHACPLGPGSRGDCYTTHECTPGRRGNRYHCSRPGPFGGACEDGPLPDGTCCRPVIPCQPRRSWRSRRAMLSLWTLAVTLGGLLVALTLPADLRPESPGPLIASHSAVADECSACHVEVVNDVFAWVRAATVGSTGINYDGCLACHELGSHKWLAHSVSAAELEQRTQAASQVTSPPPPLLRVASIVGGSGPDRSREELACSTCHPEHRGREATLTALTDDQCQTCHANQFRSLVHGHPEFRDYPYERRTRITFDHASHEGKHFQDEDADYQCGRCHHLDDAGELMRVAGFDRTCGSCHRRDIEGEGRASSNGIVFLRVPGLDVETLREHGLSEQLGVWPEFAEGDPTPFMDLLLPDRQWEDPNLDLEDLRGASENDLSSAVGFARDVRALFRALAEGGHAELRTALERAAGRTLSTHELVGLAGGLPRATLTAAHAEWLQGAPTPEEPTSEEPTSLEEPPQALASAGDDDSILLGEDDDLLASDLLGDADDGLLESDLIGDLDDGLLDDILLDEDDSYAEEAEGEEEPATAQPLEGEAWASAGGWYRSDLDYTVRYRPGAHADSFLRAWIDFSGPLRARLDATRAASLFAALSNPKSPGVCTKCHGVESSGDRPLFVNWHAYRPNPPRRRFTDFSHGPHLGTGDARGCTTCHVLDPDAPFEEARKGVDPADFASSFKPMQRETCVGCHDRSTAADSCLTCHAYHVGGVEALSHFDARTIE